MSQDLPQRLRRAVARLEELRDRPGQGRYEKVRLDGKIDGVKLAASYLEEGTRIFSPEAEPADDALTEALAKALGCEPAGFWPWSHLGQPPLTTCATHNSNGVWPCPEAERVASAITPLIERTVAAAAWQEGYTSGHSNAMRRMSDEPNAPSTPNPYVTRREDEDE